GGAGHYQQGNQYTHDAREHGETPAIRRSAQHDSCREQLNDPLGRLRCGCGGQKDYTSEVTQGQTTSRLSRLSNFAKRSWKKSSFLPIGPLRCLLTRISAMPFRSEFWSYTSSR